MEIEKRSVLSEQAKVVARREWLDLGFYYIRDDENTKWRIIGSKDGLRKFAGILRRYASNDAYDFVSAHENFGPYSYLEIGTWDRAEITKHWIAGPQESLNSLASKIDELAADLAIDETLSLKEIFSPSSIYDLELEMRTDNFDPAAEDPNL